GGAYWLEGGRSNSGFVVGDKGVVVIDTGNTPDDGRKEIAKVAEVTPKPVNQVIVTHADPDHVGGLPGFPAGTPVIAQENARSEIEASAIAAAADPKLARYVGVYSPIVAGYLPTPTISDTQTVTIDGVRMVLIHVAPAHTSGDLAVYLPKQKVVYGGDIVLTNLGRFPVIHFGGSSLGWIESMKALLALDADLYVPGHGPVVPKAKLQASLQDVEQYRAQIKAMVEQKKTMAEVMQALPEPGASPMFLSFTQTVYKELTEGYPPANPPWTNLIVRR
ncbi:MBL fold metallo-hydrolase, partial [Sphingomonas bacterium]|uniref:MBL fold metallo-hydrolase n=1 Tax=Sphingomonas bacterium TaxID=1895847 RepID=UPI001576990C